MQQWIQAVSNAGDLCLTETFPNENALKHWEFSLCCLQLTKFFVRLLLKLDWASLIIWKGPFACLICLISRIKSTYVLCLWSVERELKCKFPDSTSGMQEVCMLLWRRPPAHRCSQNFYRAMHFSAKRGIAITCRLSVRPSVCNVGGLWSHRLEYIRNNFTVS